MAIPRIRVTAFDKNGILIDSKERDLEWEDYKIVPSALDDFKNESFYTQYVAEHGAMSVKEDNVMHTIQKQEVFGINVDLEATIRKNNRHVRVYSPIEGGFVYKYYTYVVEILYDSGYEGTHKFVTLGVHYKKPGWYKRIGWNWEC